MVFFSTVAPQPLVCIRSAQDLESIPLHNEGVNQPTRPGMVAVVEPMCAPTGADPFQTSWKLDVCVYGSVPRPEITKAQFAPSLRLYPVLQRLLDQTHAPCRNGQGRFNQPRRLMLELMRVRRPHQIRHRLSLR